MAHPARRRCSRDSKIPLPNSCWHEQKQKCFAFVFFHVIRSKWEKIKKKNRCGSNGRPLKSTGGGQIAGYADLDTHAHAPPPTTRNSTSGAETLTPLRLLKTLAWLFFFFFPFSSPFSTFISHVCHPHLLPPPPPFAPHHCKTVSTLKQGYGSAQGDGEHLSQQ